METKKNEKNLPESSTRSEGVRVTKGSVAEQVSENEKTLRKQRNEAMERLLYRGMSKREIATVFRMSVGQVERILRGKKRKTTQQQREDLEVRKKVNEGIDEGLQRHDEEQAEKDKILEEKVKQEKENRNI